mmetsp:Transcript_9581/g.11467  ORF Transcript_9581/g.11467 Transcript_9581/m.11467 type:complete len:153 (+) Transcript_9581:127-585(+)|eukprot:CAMPEP_0195246192 /NCGR_PEP_ID=MMETSP0706-20130129/262_1 /TAXON_ID=33640 /ORGANISM="Asterionellopsis glacialis, Strain CCMP134" /LENGTH=152 /DNA_ID=CAMNT_0040297533 /DNA_START=109 /DNA_END=567 /DNA_ORIENTATION=+
MLRNYKNRGFVIVLFLAFIGLATSFVTPSFSHDRGVSQLSMGFMDGMQGFIKRFTTKANASHILIKGGAEAEFKLEDLKEEIGDSPVKFAEAAALYSACPSGRKGGSLGEFGPGQMVPEFDKVVFNEDVGVVHGPIKTQFGYHLILVSDRTE